MKKKRLDLGLFQSEVAKRLSVSEGTIMSWENNQCKIGYQYVPGIVAFLGYLPFNDLLDQTVEEKILILQQLLGMSLEALAQKLGVNVCTMVRWKKGKGCPKIKIIDEMLIYCSESIILRHA